MQHTRTASQTTLVQPTSLMSTAVDLKISGPQATEAAGIGPSVTT